MARKDPQAFASGHVPFAHRLIGTGAEEKGLGENQVRDVIGVSVEHGDAFDRRRFRAPKTNLLIVGARGEDTAIITQGHTIDSTLMIVECLKKIIAFSFRPTFRRSCAHEASSSSSRTNLLEEQTLMKCFAISSF